MKIAAWNPPKKTERADKTPWPALLSPFSKPPRGDPFWKALMPIFSIKGDTF